MIELNRIYCESAVVTLNRMPDDFLQLTITSPPYDKQRTCYEHAHFPFQDIAQGLWRKTKGGGTVVWIVASEVVRGSESLTPFKQAIYFVETCGFRLHDTMIYQKRNFSHPEKTRYHSVFEYMFVFTKGAPKVFNPLMDRKNVTAGEFGSKGANTLTRRDGAKGERARKVNREFGMRHNVWLGKTRGQEDMCKALPHPAMMPKWIARDHILSWSNEGDLVYDPCAGSGTVGKQASLLKRNFILSDTNADYCAIAGNEIWGAGPPTSAIVRNNSTERSVAQ